MRPLNRLAAIDNALSARSFDVQAAMFEKLFAPCEAELRAFIFALVPHWSDVDDLVQRTRIVVWKKFDQFEVGSSFRAWVLQVARHEVNNFRRTQSRDRVRFSETLIESIVDVRSSLGGDLEQCRQALQRCLRKLRASDRQIIRQCYGPNSTTIKDAAERLHRPVNTLYKALNRIRHALMECVRRADGEQRSLK